MAKSQARKLREKRIREGKRNPAENRSPFAVMDMRTRKTKTKKEFVYRCKHKNHSFLDEHDGSFFVVFPYTVYPIKRYVN